MNEFIFNGESSKDYGLVVNTLPPIVKPPIRTEKIEIDGRNGDIINNLGYTAYDKEITITRLNAKIDVNTIIKWLNFSKVGTLVLSNEPTLYYKAQIIEQIDFTRLENFEPVKIKFHVQPFKYKKDEEYKSNENTIALGKDITVQKGIGIVNTTIFGESTQKTISGKNLLKINTSKVQNGITFTNNGDGTITLNGTAEAALDLWIANGTYSGIKNQTIPANTSLIQSINVRSGNYTGTCKLRTLVWNNNAINWDYLIDNSTNTSDVDIILGATELIINANTVFNNYTIFPQLEVGTVSTNPEQFGTMPSPELPSEIVSVTSPVEIKSVGKNLLNAPSNFELTGSKVLIPSYLKAGTYVLSVENIETTGTTASLVLFNLADGTTDYYYLSNSSKSKIVTFNSDITSYNIYSQNSYSASIDVTAVFTNLMLRQENTSAEYEPHVSNQANIALLHPLRSLPNGTYDRIYKKDDKWYDEQKIGVVTYDATEEWTYYEPFRCFYRNEDGTSSSKVNMKVPATNDTINLMCNRYKGDTRNNLIEKVIDNIITNNDVYSTAGQVCIRDLRFNDVASFKAELAENNLEVQYELATPIITEITDPDTIEALENIALLGEVTHISSNAPLELEYINEYFITNLGLEQSKPIIHLQGDGTIEFKVNGNVQFTYTFPDGENEVYIDCEKQDAYVGNILKNRNMNGEFPILEVGDNIIEFTGHLTKIDILARSRWL